MRIHHNEIMLRNRRFTSANLLGYIIFYTIKTNQKLCCAVEDDLNFFDLMWRLAKIYTRQLSLCYATERTLNIFAILSTPLMVFLTSEIFIKSIINILSFNGLFDLKQTAIFSQHGLWTQRHHWHVFKADIGAAKYATQSHKQSCSQKLRHGTFLQPQGHVQPPASHECTCHGRSRHNREGTLRGYNRSHSLLLSTPK